MKMKSKKSIALVLAGALAVTALAGCKAKNEDNNNTEVDNNNETENNANSPDNFLQNEYSVSDIDVENIEKSDLAVDDVVKAELQKIDNAGYKYYNDHFKDSGFISNYSYLYSITNDKEITLQKLVDEGYYTCPDGYEKLIDETAFHLLMPKDVKKYGVEVMDATFACFYTALRTNEGVYIISPEDAGGVMTDENYRKMLLDYIPEHGDVVYPKKDSEEYKGIIKAINDKVGKEKSYDVKHMVCDNKYAVAIVGDNDKITDIKGYVLTKADNKWSVSYEGLEDMKDIITGINVHFPDISTSMIPKYSIKANGEIRTDLQKVTDGLIKSQIIENSDLPATYQCGTGKFIYMEFNSGKKVVGGVNSSNELECYSVKSAAEAVKAMHQFADDAPIYIVKMNY